MKRVIKFRAYTEISNEVLGMKYDVPHNYNDTVMQFTGLLDRHGVEIYEGDIIGFPRVGDEPEVCGFVEFDKDMGNMIVNKTNGGWDYIGNYQIEIKVFEVIGNIYKNKELLSWK